MAVRKTASGRWQAVWREPGARSQKAKSFRTKREAQGFLNLIESEKLRGTYTDPHLGKTTLEQWWASYQESGSFLSLRPSTKERYEQSMRLHVLPALGRRQLGSIRRIDVDGWMSHLARAHSPATVNAAHRVLRVVLQLAHNNALISTNPARGIKAMTLPKEEMRFLNVDEVNRIADVVLERYRALVLLLAWSGLRFGEAAALRAENLDLLRGRLQVTEAFSTVGGRMVLGECKTSASRRSVALDRLLVKDLANHLQHFPPQRGLVFTARDGGPVNRHNFWNRVWRPALKAAEIAQPFPRIHDLRHTAVAFAIATGSHPKEIQARLGHSTIVVTFDRYGHLFPGQDEALADRLGEFRNSGTLNGDSRASDTVVQLRAEGP